MNFYNDNERFAAQWLRNLIEAGHIGKGIVDERSITEIKPEELTGYTRCHFFAGIAGWELALQYANWPSDANVWCGSAPCQPFSAAGKRKGQSDDRNLWHIWFELIRVCRPPAIFGEQVEAAIGLGWLDRVFDDLEAEGYQTWACVLPACSVGAPHIRQRLFWMANAPSGFIQESRGRQERRSRIRSSGENGGLAQSNGDGSGSRRPECEGQDGAAALEPGSPDGGMANSESSRWGISHAANIRKANREINTSSNSGNGGDGPSPDGGMADAELRRSEQCDEGQRAVPELDEDGADGERMGDGIQQGLEGYPGNGAGSIRPSREIPESDRLITEAGSSNWANSRWIYCRDGKWRRVPCALSGIRPLAPRLPGRVGQLRAYGNSIVPQVAAEFIKAIMSLGRLP